MRTSPELGRWGAAFLILLAVLGSTQVAHAQDEPPDTTALVQPPGAGEPDELARSAEEAADRLQSHIDQIDYRLGLLEQASREQNLDRLQGQLRENQDEAEQLRDRALSDLRIGAGLEGLAQAVPALDLPVDLAKVAAKVVELARAEPNSEEEREARRELLGEAAVTALKQLAGVIGAGVALPVGVADLLFKGVAWQLAEQNLESAQAAAAGTLDLQLEMSALRAQKDELEAQQAGYLQIKESAQALPFSGDDQSGGQVRPEDRPAAERPPAEPPRPDQGVPEPPAVAEEPRRGFVEIPMKPGEPSIEAALGTCVLRDLACVSPPSPGQPGVDAQPQPAPTSGRFAGTWVATYSGPFSALGCTTTISGTFTMQLQQPTDGGPVSGRGTDESRVAPKTCTTPRQVTLGGADRCEAPIAAVTPRESTLTFPFVCTSGGFTSRETVTATLTSPTTAIGNSKGASDETSWETTFTATRR